MAEGGRLSQNLKPVDFAYFSLVFELNVKRDVITGKVQV